MIYRIEVTNGNIYFAKYVLDWPNDPEIARVIRFDGVTVYPNRSRVKITEVAPEAAVNDFKVGGPAVVRKYGDSYLGEVTAVRRTMISAKIKLKNRGEKVVTVPAVEAQIPGEYGI